MTALNSSLGFLSKRYLESAERGQIAVLFVVLFLVLLALAGLVVDGAAMFVNYRLGRTAVDSAALAAATALDEEQFRNSPDNLVVLNPPVAYATAARYVAENGKGRVALTGVSVAENRVTVNGTVSSPTLFFRLFNIPQVTFNLSATAELAYGITEEKQ